MDNMWLKRNDAKRFICMIITIVLSVYPMSLSPVWNGKILGHRDQYERMAQSILHGHLYLEYEDVDYWGELTRIMDWSKTHVTSTLHICWAALAGLYYHYGVRKELLDEKIFGIFQHHTIHRKTPLIRGFDDVFNAPHSRHSQIVREDVEKNPELTILADSEEAGPFIIIAKEGRQIFVTGHPEYDVLTLEGEYKRDLAKGMDNVPFPNRYYKDDKPELGPVKSWRCHANTLYTNWLNYYVYQMTTYDPMEIQNLK